MRRSVSYKQANRGKRWRDQDRVKLAVWNRRSRGTAERRTLERADSSETVQRAWLEARVGLQ